MKKQLSTLLLLALCLAGTLAYGQQNPLAVRFAWGTEVFPENYDAVRQKSDVQAAEVASGYYVRYIQCSEIMPTTDRATLEAAGMKFYGYVHFGAYLVGIPQNFDLGKLAALRVRSIVRVQNEWKMARTLRERPFGDWAVHGEEVDINIQLYPHVGIGRGAELCRQRGLTVLKEGTQNGFLQLRVAQTNLEAISALSFVRHMELVPPPPQKEDINGRSIHRANVLDADSPLGKKYNGEGVNILVRDDGQLGPHIDLQGRLDNSLAKGAATDGTHGDGVGGIMGGAGNLDPTKKGMAAGSKLYVLDYEADFQDETLPLHLDENVTITNSSYSNGCNVGYTIITQTIDQQLHDNPTLMHVFSAGNANGQDCGYGAGNQWGNITGGHKMGKNAIATANLNADMGLELTSSRGPAHDGRLKPDISAHGAGQNSLNPNNGYQVFGGTSAAAPGIAGCLTQLTHAYKTINNEQPPAALLKASILNTANDLGNLGPDFKFGWGHINTWRALRTFELNRWRTDSVDNGAEKTHTISIPNLTRYARLMVVWPDVPADEEASRALINDLDITVTGPTGTVYLPWKLDPTPDETILDTPAGKGRDSLNNVEQVAIDMPAAGTYTVRVKGTEVPFGPQQYYLVWDFQNDDIKITYPNGGEGFVPGEKERIHWDAYGTATSFTLRYSTDGGATFNPVSTITGEKRTYDWTVPNTVSGQVKFLLLRNPRRDTSDFNSSIAAVPKNLRINKVCPDSMFIAWDKVNDTLSYDAFLLGEKYMEVVGTVKGTNIAGFPISDPFVENWVSVRSSYPNGLTGRRALAIRSVPGLKGCPQAFDANVKSLLSPQTEALVACSAFETDVTVQISNDGQNTLSGLKMNYQTGADPVVSETVPDLAPGASLDFTFQKKLSIGTGLLALSVWSTYSGDQVPFNDTLQYSIPTSAGSKSGYFEENFEALEPLPGGWLVSNPDGDVSWEKFEVPNVEVIGSDGQPTEAMFLNHFDYESRGPEDYLYMVPVDLSTTPSPGLTFDLAHVGYDENFADSLRVEVFANCDLNSTPETIWGKKDPKLATDVDQTTFFLPDNETQWRTEEISLAKYAGQKVIIRFVSVNDFGNNLYLDNIGINKLELTPPNAAFTPSNDTVCRAVVMQFEINTPTIATNYAWSFGSNASPLTATGPGPHDVRYVIAGVKTAQCIASNPIEADTSDLKITVIGSPSANFTSAPSGLTVTFTNTSTNAATYLWDFGDGQTSTEKNPVHTYATPGTKAVKLSATNYCNTLSKTSNVVLTSGVRDLEGKVGVQILPNPTVGDFAVEMTSRISGEARLSLLDAQGRLLKTASALLKPSTTVRVPFAGLQLPAGVYQLNVQTDEGLQTFSVVVQ